MPALIQPTMLPTYQATTLDEYLKPLQEYKNAYDAMEKSYNALEDQAAVLESLKADYPDSEAYRQYSQYQQNLSEAADTLASVGLTPNSRKALHRMRERYTKELIPIINGYSKIKEAQNRFNQLKPGEVMSYDPYRMSIDQFIGNNPEFRNYNLEAITNQAMQAARAHSAREDLYYLDDNFSKQLADNYQSAVAHMQGFLNSSPKLLKTIKNAEDVIKTMFNDPDGVNSKDPLIQDIVAQVKSYDLTKMSDETKGWVLNSILHGTISGLTGSKQYQFLANKGISASSGSSEGPTLNDSQTFLMSPSGVAINDEIRDVVDNYHETVRELYQTDPAKRFSLVAKFDKQYKKEHPTDYSEDPYSEEAKAWIAERDKAFEQHILANINQLRKDVDLPALTNTAQINSKSMNELDSAIDKKYGTGLYEKSVAVYNTQDASTALSYLQNKIGDHSFSEKESDKVMWAEDKNGKLRLASDPKSDEALYRMLDDKNTKIIFDFGKQTDRSNKGVIKLKNNTISNMTICIAPQQIFSKNDYVEVGALKQQLAAAISRFDYDALSDTDKEYIEAVSRFINDRTSSMYSLFECLGNIQNLGLDNYELQANKANVWNALLTAFGDNFKARTNLQVVSKSGTSSNEQPTNKNTFR